MPKVGCALTPAVCQRLNVYEFSCCYKVPTTYLLNIPQYDGSV